MRSTIKTRSGRVLELPTDDEDAEINRGIAADPDTYVPSDEQFARVKRRGTRTWNYRVIEFVTDAGEAWRAIHEVHYVDDIPIAYAETPASVVCGVDEGDHAIAATLEKMRAATSKPVLKEQDFPDDGNAG